MAGDGMRDRVTMQYISPTLSAFQVIPVTFQRTDSMNQHEMTTPQTASDDAHFSCSFFSLYATFT